METSSFCSSYRLIHTLRLAPLPTAGNGLAFSSSLSFNGVPLSRSKKYGSCKSRSSPSPSSLARIRCGKVPEINETEFSDVVLKSDRPVLVEFVATWCGPCRLIAPAIEALAQEYEDKLAVVKVDHDANPRLIEEYKVYGLPMLILFKDGKEVPESRREGAITKVKLKGYIDGLLESVTVS